MYHAVPQVSQSLGNASEPAWDPHYAVGADAFRLQISGLLSAGLHVTSVRAALDGEARAAAKGVACLTFDDGTHTDAEVAFPILASLGAKADFFVNSSTVNTPGFVNWRQLREMAEAGMSIQSHAHSHRFLEDLDAANLRDELGRSKAEIEDRLGQAVSLLAPPGGRFSARVVDMAMDLGYEAICSSRPGRWRVGQGPVLPRVAVLADDQTGKIIACGRGDFLQLAPLMIRHGAAWSIKKLLGNNAYVMFRERILAALKGKPG